MKKYLEKTLRQIVTIKENNDLYDKLPLAFKAVSYTHLDVYKRQLHLPVILQQ